MHREIKIQRIRLKLNHNKGIQITSFFNYVANILNKKKKTKRNTCFRSPFSMIWDLLLCRQKARFSHDRSQIDFNVLVSHLSGIQNQNADSTAWFLRLCLSLHLDIQKAEPEHFQRAGQGDREVAIRWHIHKVNMFVHICTALFNELKRFKSLPSAPRRPSLFREIKRTHTHPEPCQHTGHKSRTKAK